MIAFDEAKNFCDKDIYCKIKKLAEPYGYYEAVTMAMRNTGQNEYISVLGVINQAAFRSISFLSESISYEIAARFGRQPTFLKSIYHMQLGEISRPDKVHNFLHTLESYSEYLEGYRRGSRRGYKRNYCDAFENQEKPYQKAIAPNNNNNGCM